MLLDVSSVATALIFATALLDRDMLKTDPMTDYPGEKVTHGF